MKIRITTVREFPKKLYWYWARATLDQYQAADPDTSFGIELFRELLATGRAEVKEEDQPGSVWTTYEITEE